MRGKLRLTHIAHGVADLNLFFGQVEIHDFLLSDRGSRIADRFPRNTAGEYAAILASVLRGVIPDGVLVRISTIGTDIAASDSGLADFTAMMAGSLAPAGRRILLGTD